MHAICTTNKAFSLKCVLHATILNVPIGTYTCMDVKLYTRCVECISFADENYGSKTYLDLVSMTFDREIGALTRKCIG